MMSSTPVKNHLMGAILTNDNKLVKIDKEKLISFHTVENFPSISTQNLYFTITENGKYVWEDGKVVFDEEADSRLRLDVLITIDPTVLKLTEILDYNKKRLQSPILLTSTNQYFRELQQFNELKQSLLNNNNKIHLLTEYCVPLLVSNILEVLCVSILKSIIQSLICENSDIIFTKVKESVNAAKNIHRDWFSRLPFDLRHAFTDGPIDINSKDLKVELLKYIEVIKTKKKSNVQEARRVLSREAIAHFINIDVKLSVLLNAANTIHDFIKYKTSSGLSGIPIESNIKSTMDWLVQDKLISSSVITLTVSNFRDLNIDSHIMTLLKDVETMVKVKRTTTTTSDIKKDYSYHQKDTVRRIPPPFVLLEGEIPRRSELQYKKRENDKKYKQKKLSFLKGL